MTENLRIQGPFRRDEFDIYEAVDDSSENPGEHIYSCVALCRRKWRRDWPALGGTRWFKGRDVRISSDQGTVQNEAIELAMSMYIKNSLLRNAAPPKLRELFDWQGGKGVIWTPAGAPLTPKRLICHGRLVESLNGQYIASKDQGVGTRELKWISCATRYTIGLGCLRDTGEATAHGVLTGLRKAAQHHGLGPDPERPLKDVSILVCGIGKVGYPLVGLLSAEGADVYIFDPYLEADLGKVEEWCHSHEDPAVPLDIRKRNCDALKAILDKGRILDRKQEGSALRHPEIQIVSPNGGGTRWLSDTIPEGGSRVEALAESRRQHGRLRLILGAGNDQVPITDFRKDEREPVLAMLADADITYVPDPLVSPGGVIAVSYELAATWDASEVNQTAIRIVDRSVGQIYSKAESLEGFDAVRMYRAFEDLIEQDWN